MDMRIIIRTLFLSWILLITVCADAQQFNDTSFATGCGFDVYMSELRKSPEYQAKEQSINDQIRSFTSSQTGTIRSTAAGTRKQAVKSLSVSGGVIYIPVVVHIVNQDPASITDQMVIDAIKDLNDAFAHVGVYSADTLGANTGIQFCLAKTAPDGSLTNGIERINSFYEINDVDMERNALKKLSNWDPAKYANIWLVKSIRGEIAPTTFSCGKWIRRAYGGYAGPGEGAVVSGLSAPMLAHELGHYLSLLHTFEGMNCLNGDCTTQGDLVCDTPPDRSTASSPCNSPENSCSTDTLSGPYKVDMPDNIANFMDYSSSCPSMFTKGQADRMIAFLNVFSGGSLLNSNRCDPPCTDNILAQFDYNANPHPITGTPVSFSNTSAGAVDFEWYVDGILQSTSKDFIYTFNTDGNYAVKLLAYNASRTCVSSCIANVESNCGVFARFTPDKRIIAAATGVYKDPVLFENISYGADTYVWMVSDKFGNNFQVIPTPSKDLLYDFPGSGNYRIKLQASKGSCVVTSSVYTMNVLDPRPEGIVSVNRINCYKEDSIRVVFNITNVGYDTIPAGTVIGFYDNYSASMPNPQKLKNSFVLNQDIYGGNCNASFVHIVKTVRPKQDTIRLVFDDLNQLNELSETNNSNAYRKFQFRVASYPPTAHVYVNSNLMLLVSQTQSYPDAIMSAMWTPANTLSCNNCVNPSLLIQDTTLMKVVATSMYDCIDSSQSYITVYPLDMDIRQPTADCYKNDSLLIQTKICLGNGYRRLKKRITIEYYDRDISTGTANLLGIVYLDSTTQFSNACLDLTTVVKMTKTPNVYVYVNRIQTQYEPVIINNSTSVNYVPFNLTLYPTDIDIYRGDPVQVSIINQGDVYKKILWTPSEGVSCNDCLTPLIQTNVNRNYAVVGYTKYYCTDTAYMNIKAYYQSHLALPNVFTPNGDGLNDYFYVIAGKEVVAVNQFQIFSRWGEKVFEARNTSPNSYSGGWNGYYKGKLAEGGTYVYYITISLSDGTKEEVKGNITLIR